MPRTGGWILRIRIIFLSQKPDTNTRIYPTDDKNDDRKILDGEIMHRGPRWC
jgi:hypothetical protein